MPIRERTLLRLRDTQPLDSWSNAGLINGAGVQPIALTASHEAIFVDQAIDEYTTVSWRTVNIQFRAQSGPGATREALHPWNVPTFGSDKNAYHVPILEVAPNTAYQVRSQISGKAVRTDAVTTRANPPSPTLLVPTHHVRPSGNDANAGTSRGAAWLTLQQAVTAANSATADMVIAVEHGYYRKPTSVLTGNGHKITFCTVDSSGALDFAVDGDAAITHGDDVAAAVATGARTVVYDLYAAPTASSDTGSLGNGGWTQLDVTGIGDARNYAGGVVPGDVPEYTIWRKDVGLTYVRNVAFSPAVSGGDYAAQKLARPSRLAPWTSDAGTILAQVSGWAETMSTNYSLNEGHWTTGGADNYVYLRLPGGVDPNTRYIWMGGNTLAADGQQGFTLNGPDHRIVGFEFRCLSNSVRFTKLADRGLMERCVTVQSAILFNCTGDDGNYLEDPTIQDCYFYDSRAWSTDGSRQIPWRFIKGAVVCADLVSSIGGEMGSDMEMTQVFGRRYIKRAVVRRNWFEGMMNGVGCSQDSGNTTRQQNYGYTIAHNYFQYVADNPIEHEDIACNWAVWDNVYYQCKTCYSDDFNVGPVVYFKELGYEIGGKGITNDGHPTTPAGTGGDIFKWGGPSSPRSAIYVINCTYIALGFGDPVWADSVNGIANQYFYVRNTIAVSDDAVWQDPYVGSDITKPTLDDAYSFFATPVNTGDAAIIVDGVRYDATGVTGAKSVEAYRTAQALYVGRVEPTGVGGGLNTNRAADGLDYNFINTGTRNGFAKIKAMFVGDIQAVTLSAADMALHASSPAKLAGVALGHLHDGLGRLPNMGHIP